MRKKHEFEINNFRDKIYYLPIDGSIPGGSLRFIWIIWIVFSVLFMDIVLTNELFCFAYKYSAGFLCGMLPGFIAFHDKNYVEKIVKSRYRFLMIPLYKDNIIMMILSYFALSFDWGNGDTGGYSYLVRESVLFAYWFLSIPLAVIYNKKKWCIAAMLILANSMLYLYLLQNITKKLSEISFQYYLFTVGIIFVSGIVSLMISYHQIHKYYTG